MQEKKTIERIWLDIRKNEKNVIFLRTVSGVCVAVFALAAGWIAVSAFLRSVQEGVLTCLTALLLFAAVSLVRMKINLPRPYDTFDLLSDKEKATVKRGRSFPSRHTFSAFLIAGLMLSSSLLCAVILLFLACLLAGVRVCLAYHYPRDVIAGAVLGILSAGLVYFLSLLFLSSFT